MIPLSQKSLVKTKLRFRDRTLKMATLLPLFESEGRVRALLVVDHEAGCVYEMEWSRGLVNKPWFRPVRIERRVDNLMDLTARKSYQLTKYWHYDPWWLLKEEPFLQHPATPALTSTNSADELSAMSSLNFCRDLSQVQFMTRQNGDSTQLVHLKNEPLPPREEREAPLLEREENFVQRAGGWRLRPFWEREIVRR